MEYEVIIPTTIEDPEDVLTLESVPEDVPVHIEREGTLNEARNRGVGRVDAPVAVIMDDDISFSAEVLAAVADMVDDRTLVGLEDHEYGLLRGRVMAFATETWDAVGGFDERLRSHAGDTEFCLRMLEHGCTIERLADDYFHHEEHERSVTTFDRASRLVYLAVQHPRFAPLLVTGTLHFQVRDALLGERVREAIPGNTTVITDLPDG